MLGSKTFLHLFKFSIFVSEIKDMLGGLVKHMTELLAKLEEVYGEGLWDWKVAQNYLTYPNFEFRKMQLQDFAMIPDDKFFSVQLL